MASRPPDTPGSAAGELSTVDALVQLSFLIHGMLERVAADHGLSITQTRMLGILRDRRPSMNELAKLLSLDKSSVSGLVDRAERRDLVERAPAAADRRSIVVSLTGNGRAVVAGAGAAFAADVSGILDCLMPSDRDALTSLVSRLLVVHAAKEGIELFPAGGPERAPTIQRSESPSTRASRRAGRARPARPG
jgi:MarR family transcriptional regulator, lower aerobic nicotinate degradation pathway regulator